MVTINRARNSRLAGHKATKPRRAYSYRAECLIIRARVNGERFDYTYRMGGVRIVSAVLQVFGFATRIVAPGLQRNEKCSNFKAE